MVLGEGGCEPHRACGCRDRGAEMTHASFVSVESQVLMRGGGGAGKSKYWFSEIGTPGVGQEKQSRGSICACGSRASETVL